MLGKATIQSGMPVRRSGAGENCRRSWHPPTGENPGGSFRSASNPGMPGGKGMRAISQPDAGWQAASTRSLSLAPAKRRDRQRRRPKGSAGLASDDSSKVDAAGTPANRGATPVVVCSVSSSRLGSRLATPRQCADPAAAWRTMRPTQVAKSSSICARSCRKLSSHERAASGGHAVHANAVEVDTGAKRGPAPPRRWRARLSAGIPAPSGPGLPGSALLSPRERKGDDEAR